MHDRRVLVDAIIYLFAAVVFVPLASRLRLGSVLGYLIAGCVIGPFGLGLVRDVGSDLGLTIAWRATGGVCDGNNIAACGVPVVDTMGARGGAIHSGEEFLIVDSLPERAALSAVTMLRIAEGRL